ncbi:MAG: CRISPR-associated endonuclease Cas2 [Gallionella sp.]|nr:CRISPR-associated endonuclease Cas2 [Gallionella sp.]
MRLWVIAYDIANDRRRRALVKLLAQCMERVQESVFEGWLNPMEIREVIRQTKEIIESAEDKVRAYPLALRNEKRCKTLGGQKPARHPQDYWIVG